MSVEVVANDEIALVERKLRMNKRSTTADLWQVGVNQALRISDQLKLPYGQLTGDVLEITEGKTQKKSQDYHRQNSQRGDRQAAQGASRTHLPVPICW